MTTDDTSPKTLAARAFADQVMRRAILDDLADIYREVVTTHELALSATLGDMDDLSNVAFAVGRLRSRIHSIHETARRNGNEARPPIHFTAH